MSNWTCKTCTTYNSPRREVCWNCGNGRSATPSSIGQTPTANIWARIPQIFRILGAIGAVAIIASLFLPWVIHQIPERATEIYAGYTTSYGLVTAVIGLILLILMVKPNLKKGWYILAIILAIVAYFMSWMPVQISQVFDTVAAELGGTGSETAVSIPGSGVSVVNLAVVLVTIAAIAQLFRPKATNAPAEALTLPQG
ncbi:MAG: hypothetical protein KC445_13265 [Anaerolineales bacterium]|nr:hypothetical protein [Anaerolineales bacterium]